ncbi:MAG: A24 family peptidase [Sulfuriferula sp.]|nr:A24 family peptidase [Sulfuriferula sp.]
MLALMQADPVLFTIACGVVGLLVGSFLNVVIYRLPKIMEREWHEQCAALNDQPVSDQAPFSLSVPRSACPSCGHKISALENIPIVSYLWLRGKCAGCNTRISPRYPVIEALTGILSAAAAGHFGMNASAIGAIFLIWALIALTFIDFDIQLLPDSITLPLLWLGLLFNLQSTFVPLQSAVIGAMVGYLSLWSIYWLFKLATGKEGMGFGDFKLLAAIGAWLGWSMLPLVILLSSAVGAIVGIILIILAKQGRSVPIPFGPYLAGGGLIALFWGPGIMQSYLATLT